MGPADPHGVGGQRDGGRDAGRRAAQRKGCEHTTRHNRVVGAWVRAVQPARGAAHTRATAEAPAWSAPSVPDFVSEYAGQAGAHQAGEVKVYNTIICDAAQLLRG